MELIIEIFEKNAIKIFFFVYKLASYLKPEQRFMAMPDLIMSRLISKIFTARASAGGSINEHYACTINVQDSLWDDIRQYINCRK